MTELTLEESLRMFMAEIAKRLDENTNLIKEIQASMDFALRNQKASIKALEIQVRKISIILHEKLFGDLRSSTEIMPNVNDEAICRGVNYGRPHIYYGRIISLRKKNCRLLVRCYNWETAKYGKIWYDEDVHDLRSVETEFPAIVFNDKLTSEEALSCETTVSPLNDNKNDFRISFDEFDDEDYTSSNIDEFDLKDETSLSEYDEEEQNVLYFNDLFLFNVIYPDDLSDKDNDNDKIDIKQSSGGNVINADDAAYAQSYLRIEESVRMQDSGKPKGNNVAGPLVVNMVEHKNSSKYNDNQDKRKHHDYTKADPNKNSKVTCWKCRKPGHLIKDCRGGKVGNKANGSGTNGLVDGSNNSLKGQNMFNKSFQTYESLNDGSILHMGNESTTLVHGCGCVDLSLNTVNDNIGSAFMSTSKLNDSILWYARLSYVYFKRMQDMSKDGLIPAFDMDTEKCKTCMLTKITKKPFQNVKHETEVLELMHSDLCDLHATPSLENKKYFVTFIDDASRAIVRLLDPKLKTLGERCIECIFVRYAEKDFRFLVSEPDDSVAINSIIESRDDIFNKNRFYLVPRPSLRIINETADIGGSVVPEEVTEVVVQDEVSYQHSYCFNVEDDPKTFDEEMKSQDVAFWKEAINDEMISIMCNNTWVLADLPPGCKPLG
ncbi:zinc finger, CCHC-type containing protein [Tanacetum coccineum]